MPTYVIQGGAVLFKSSIQILQDLSDSMSCSIPPPKICAEADSLLSFQIGDRAKFYWCAAAGLMGIIVTFIFIPEITDLDLREGDKRWELVKAGLLHANQIPFLVSLKT